MIILFIYLFIFKFTSAESFQKDCGCNRSFKPVCGNNEQTYENLCKLMCEQRLNLALKLDYPGTCCPKAEFCTTFDDPVCDNLGETHKNQCKFNHKQCVAKKQKNFNLKIQKKGPCEPQFRKPEFQSCTFFCDEADEPLCDNLGHTHQNLCKFDLAKCRKLSRGLEVPEIIHIGACNISDQKRNLLETLKARVAPRMIIDPPDEAHKIWHYGAFPTPATQFTAEMNPYDFEPFPAPEDPARTTKQTTLKPWQSSPLPQISTSETKYETVPSSSSSTFEKTDPEFVRTTIVPSLFSSCLSCESEIDQVPICDNFNQTHKSICKFARWNCERRMSGLQERVLVHIGICNVQSPTFTMEEEVCPPKCSKSYKPVCDTNGMTHPNLCTFQMFNCQQRKLGNIHVAWLLYLKECALPPPLEVPEASTTVSPSTTTTVSEIFDCPKPDCPRTSNIICDSQGVYHKNDCEFTYARCLAAKQGITLRIMPEEFCVSHPNCDMLNISNCTNEYDPICATDFLTYPNHCHFLLSKCKDSSLDILFRGECKKCLNTPCPIVDAADSNFEDSLFICDQNGETKSRCEFQMLQCIYEIKFRFNITEAYNGRCCPRDELCPLDDKPVCDSRGQFHRNICYFSVAKCQAEKIEHDSLSEAPCPKISSNHDECLKTVCSNDYDPVCGTDGKTYSNLCHFTQKTCNNSNSMMIDIAYRGSCCEEKCSKVDFSPVCDNYNVTHLNLCEFGSQRCIASRTGKNLDMKIVEYETCDNIDCKLNCPAIYEPVCAVNGETFSNECELARAVCILNNAGGTSLSVNYEGQCCSNTQCDLDFKPVCDSDGRTHINECVFKQEACLSERKNGLNLTIEHQGECCNQVCENSDNNQQKVCDSYGVTHNSVCEFLIKKCEAERSGRVVSLAYMDECCQPPPSHCGNETIICDSDGQTHQNICEFEYRKCIIERTQPKSIAIIHAGECCHLEKCTEKTNPVCDSRGITHQSFCHFRNNKCVYDKVHNNGSNLILAYNGECCKLDCNNVSEPICDQNGEVYKNKCFFEHAKCEASKRARDEEILVLTPCNKVRTKI